MYALLPKPLYEVLSYTFHLLHLSFVCVDIHVRVCECVVCCTMKLIWFFWFFWGGGLKRNVHMNSNHQYHNYTLIVSPCLPFHII